MFWLNAIYLFVVFAVSIFSHSPLSKSWLVQFLNLFTPLAFGVLPLLGIISVLTGNWRALSVLVVPLLILLFEYGSDFVPKRQSNLAGESLRVMSWNTLYLNTDVKSAFAAIQRLQPDIIALQELGVDLAAGLADKLADYPHRALFPRNSPKGYGIFSRYPITHSVPPKIAENEYWLHQVRICYEGREFTLINAHPRIPDIHLRHIAGIPIPVGFDTEPQDVQLRCLLQQIERVEGALLLVGDFNLSDRQPMYREFARRLNDAHRVAGWGFGFTFPTDLAILSYFKVPIPAVPMIPFLRLDYQFYDNSWRAIRVQNSKIAGSDHRSLIVDLDLKN